MPWTGNNTWTCNQCKYTVTAFGSVVSGGVSDSANQKTVRKLRIIIAHMEEHNRKKREMSKQDEQAGQAPTPHRPLAVPCAHRPDSRSPRLLL